MFVPQISEYVKNNFKEEKNIKIEIGLIDQIIHENDFYTVNVETIENSNILENLILITHGNESITTKIMPKEGTFCICYIIPNIGGYAFPLVECLETDFIFHRDRILEGLHNPQTGGFIGFIEYTNNANGLILTSQGIENLIDTYTYPNPCIILNTDNHEIKLRSATNTGFTSHFDRYKDEFLSENTLITESELSVSSSSLILGESEIINTKTKKRKKIGRYFHHIGVGFSDNHEKISSTVNTINETTKDYINQNEKHRVAEIISPIPMEYEKLSALPPISEIKYGIADSDTELPGENENHLEPKDVSNLVLVDQKEFYVSGNNKLGNQVSVRVGANSVKIQTKGALNLPTLFEIDITSGSLKINANVIEIDAQTICKLGKSATFPVNNLPVCPLTGSPHGTNPKILA